MLTGQCATLWESEMCRNLRGPNGQRSYRRQASQSQPNDIFFCRFVAKFAASPARLATGDFALPMIKHFAHLTARN